MEEDIYRDCMRNHAATLGTHATDGCGVYTPDTSSSSCASHGSLLCAACGCHRNFHRKVPAGHHHHHQYPLLLRYSPKRVGDRGHNALSFEAKKRTRTKFSSEQKEKMTKFAEKIGWRIPRREGDGADELGSFCREVGVSRQIFKLWMHNHKSSSSSTTTSSAPTAAGAAFSSSPINASRSPSFEQ